MMNYKSTIPEGQSGLWEVKRYAISQKEAGFANLRSACGHPHEAVRAGEYTKLMRGGAIVMSDTPMEVNSALPFVRQASGTVLVSGLGLGCIIEMLLAKSVVEKVTVLEICAHVIKLVGGHLEARYNGRLQIVHADALTWKPKRDESWTCIWHDIWDSICTDNKSTMTKLHRKYVRRCNYQESWMQHEVTRLSC